METMRWDFFVIDVFGMCDDDYFILMSNMFPIPVLVQGDNDNEPQT